MLNNYLMSLKKFMTRILDDVNYRILWIELALFFILLGTVPHLWPVACLMFLGLSLIFNKPKGMLYMIYILSFGWGVMATTIAYFLSGWGWGIAWGLFTLICALGLHFRDLKQPLYSISKPGSPPKFKQKPSLGRFNLN
jgi:hypothetical protein